jgi:hypothetical protein
MARFGNFLLPIKSPVTSLEDCFFLTPATICIAEIPYLGLVTSFLDPESCSALRSKLFEGKSVLVLFSFLLMFLFMTVISASNLTLSYLSFFSKAYRFFSINAY